MGERWAAGGEVGKVELMVQPWLGLIGSFGSPADFEERTYICHMQPKENETLPKLPWGQYYGGACECGTASRGALRWE